MKEKNGGNIDSNCCVGRKFLWKMRGKGKRKFVVIIWREGENRGKERKIRAVSALQQAVYSSKLYLVFPVLATLPHSLPGILHTDHACSLHFVHASGNFSQPLHALPANQSSNLPQLPNRLINHILQFGNLSFYSLAE